VLAQFEPNATREKNHAVMLKALLGVLPKAREAGCLNHVRNDDVISVDVSTQDVPSAQWEAVVKAAEAAVAAKKVERFLAPPREPEAFHFEFARNAGTSPNAAVEKSKPKAGKPVRNQ
jgi:dihydroxyacid dehydratase/phosphogluconate dehydratase